MKDRIQVRINDLLNRDLVVEFHHPEKFEQIGDGHHNSYIALQNSKGHYYIHVYSKYNEKIRAGAWGALVDNTLIVWNIRSIYRILNASIVLEVIRLAMERLHEYKYEVSEGWITWQPVHFNKNIAYFIHPVGCSHIDEILEVWRMKCAKCGMNTPVRLMERGVCAACNKKVCEICKKLLTRMDMYGMNSDIGNVLMCEECYYVYKSRKCNGCERVIVEGTLNEYATYSHSIDIPGRVLLCNDCIEYMKDCDRPVNFCHSSACGKYRLEKCATCGDYIFLHTTDYPEKYERGDDFIELFKALKERDEHSSTTVFYYICDKCAVRFDLEDFSRPQLIEPFTCKSCKKQIESISRIIHPDEGWPYFCEDENGYAICTDCFKKLQQHNNFVELRNSQEVSKYEHNQTERTE